MEDLKDRILEVSKKLELSHIGSNLSCLPILQEIYSVKKPQDKVILDNAHAHLSHLVVKENSGFIEPTIEKYGIHCDVHSGCDSSGGSLGHGIGIGIGMAIIDRSRDVYVIVSDGSMMEGSNWEALRIANSLNLTNLHIHCNFNGYTAVSESDPEELYQKMKYLYSDITLHKTSNGEGFDGIQGHYKKL